MKIAVVTGASSGLGQEFARQISLIFHSFDEIWVIARRTERLRQLSTSLMTPVRILDKDLLSPSFADEFSALLEEKQADIRLLVNAAGFGKAGTFSHIAEDGDIQEKMIDLNCRALTMMTRLCLPRMSAGSRIIQVASAAAFCSQPSFAVYSATKSYVLSFSKALGRELAPRHIYVTALCPGPVDTEFFDVAGEGAIPLKRFFTASPEHVVSKALADARNKKAVSVYGLFMHTFRLMAKLLPSSLIMKAETILAGKSEEQ